MTLDSNVPRLRFAPSPTGSPHVGSLRTALFNWALARNMGGDFILRIDDTDSERNEPAAVAEMLDALNWLGLDWDEGPDVGGEYGPYRQSERRDRHIEVARQLAAQGDAYHGDDPDGSQNAAGQGPIRLRLPREGHTVVEDALRGPVRFANEDLHDPVLVRADGSPLYHLAAVVDDHDMAISHVVRGEEWLSTTPIHAYLYERLGWSQPVWVHLPLVLNPHGRKLSKREMSERYVVDSLISAGYLPEALFNYLLLLGWSPPQEEEIVNKWLVRQQFQLERLSASPATFDWDRLNWFNRHYLAQKSNARFAELMHPYLEDAYGDLNVGEQWLVRLAGLIRDGVVRLSDVVEAAEWAVSEQFDFSPEAEEALEEDSSHPVLVRLVAELASVVLLDEETARHILQGLRRHFAESAAWEAAQVYRPVRAALTGRVHGPPLHEIMGLLGKGRCLERAAVILRG
ncbi:MAG TPA: glutamate--tRNA ligase family protein [Candidatus Sulfomarinibacteraceae bacterium]|nr:glutamate--tRNA ligase family protein [Candidatus Sulfomarinibacteraceae bacterium]